MNRDMPEKKWVPKHLLAPVSVKPPAKIAKPPPESAARSTPVRSGEHVQECKVKWARTKKLHAEPVRDYITAQSLAISQSHPIHLAAAVKGTGHIPVACAVRCAVAWLVVGAAGQGTGPGLLDLTMNLRRQRGPCVRSRLCAIDVL